MLFNCIWVIGWKMVWPMYSIILMADLNRYICRYRRSWQTLAVEKGMHSLLTTLVAILTTVNIIFQDHGHYLEAQKNLFLFLLVMMHFLWNLIWFWIWRSCHVVVISVHDVIVNKMTPHFLCVVDSSLSLKLGGNAFYRIFVYASLYFMRI